MTLSKPVPKGQQDDFLASTMGTSSTTAGGYNRGGGILYRSTLNGLLAGPRTAGSSTAVVSSTSTAASTIREGPVPQVSFVAHEHHGAGPSARSIMTTGNVTSNGSNREPSSIFVVTPEEDSILAGPASGSSTTRHITRPPVVVSSLDMFSAGMLPSIDINNNISPSGAAARTSHTTTSSSSSRYYPHNMYTNQSNNVLSLNSRNLAHQLLMSERMIMDSSPVSPLTSYHVPSFPPLSRQYHQHCRGHNLDDLLSSSLFVNHRHPLSNINTYGFGLDPTTTTTSMAQLLQSSTVPHLPPFNRMRMLNDPHIIRRRNQFSNRGVEDLVNIVTVAPNTRFMQDLHVDGYHQQLLLASQERSYPRGIGGTAPDTATAVNTITGDHSSPEYYVNNLNNYGSSPSFSSIPMVTATAAVTATNDGDDAADVIKNESSPAYYHQPKQDTNQKRAFSSLATGIINYDSANDDDSAPRPAAHNSPSPRKKQKQITKKSDHNDESTKPSSSSHHDDIEQSSKVASINKKKSPVSKASKKSSNKDGTSTQKRYPLNAYNFFFSDERERIIQSLLKTGKLPNENIDDETSDSNTTKRSASSNDEDWCKKKLLEHIERHHAIKGKRRQHRKTHGVIGFKDLAREISQRWKRLLPHRVKYYQELAEMDRDIYYREQMKELESRRNYCLGDDVGDDKSEDDSS